MTQKKNAPTLHKIRERRVTLKNHHRHRSLLKNWQRHPITDTTKLAVQSNMSLSGLAAKIRSTDGLTEAETFDLAGKDPTTIANAVKAAFAEPFENDVSLLRIRKKHQI